MLTRRQLLTGAAATGAALLAPRALAPWTWGPASAWGAPPLFQRPLALPPALDVRASTAAVLTMRNGVHDFGLGAGPTFCYQATGAAPSYLGPTIVARRGSPLALTVHNELGEHPLGAFVDTTLHGALDSDRTHPRASLHQHGGNTRPDSDGGPHDTFAPGRSRTYVYDHEQEAAGLWYHDHALAITRLNVYAGLAGGYLLRDDHDPGDGSNALPAGPYEVPLVLQDRLFTEDGHLDYPLGEGVTWAPEMFGDVPTVNGTAYPELVVDRTRYRFRVYNGSNARVYDLRWRVVTTGAARPFHQIGTDGGLLDAPVPLTSLVLAPGERADLVVDLTGLPAGARVLLANRATTPYPNGPRAARRGGAPLPALLQLTAVGPVRASSALPSVLRPPMPRLSQHVTASTRTRTMSLVEVDGPLQPLTALLNSQPFTSARHAQEDQHVAQHSLEVWELVNTTGDAHPIHLHLVQFQVLDRQKADVAGYLAAAEGEYPPPPVTPFLRGGRAAPAAREAGWKDTVLAMPGEVTRIAVPFGQPPGVPPVASPRVWPTGEPGASDYVWHCHILEHEDNDMMQAYRIS